MQKAIIQLQIQIQKKKNLCYKESNKSFYFVQARNQTYYQSHYVLRFKENSLKIGEM